MVLQDIISSTYYFYETNKDAHHTILNLAFITGLAAFHRMHQKTNRQSYGSYSLLRLLAMLRLGKGKL